MKYYNFILSTFIKMNRTKTVTFVFFVFMMVTLFFSCKENSTEPITTDEFQVEIIVKDSLGNPVPNLRICGGNICAVNLGSELGVAWTPAVYLAKLLVQDTTQTSILFQDSIYMVYAELDVAAPGGILGYTSSTGTFITKNVKKFPGLFSLPEMNRTGEASPEPLGTFQILDTATFVLYDTTNHKSQSFNGVIKNKLNKFEIVWQPTEIRPKSAYSFLHSFGSSVHKESSISKSTQETTWVLNQNYPNPFNNVTTINYEVQSSSVATIIVSDFLGEDKQILMDHQKVSAGVYQLYFYLR